MNAESSKASETNRFKLDLTDKLNLKNQTKIWLQPIEYFITFGKTSSQNTTTINLKFQLQLGMILLIYLMVPTQFPPIQIYLSKIKNRIVFKIKAGYRSELLTPEAMKLLGSTKKC